MPEERKRIVQNSVDMAPEIQKGRCLIWGKETKPGRSALGVIHYAVIRALGTKVRVCGKNQTAVHKA